MRLLVGPILVFMFSTIAVSVCVADVPVADPSPQLTVIQQNSKYLHLHESVMQTYLSNSRDLTSAELLTQFETINNSSYLSEFPEDAIKLLEAQLRVILNDYGENVEAVLVFVRMATDLNIKSFLWRDNYLASTKSFDSMSLILENVEFPYEVKATLRRSLQEVESKIHLASNSNQGVNQKRFEEFLYKTKLQEAATNCGRFFSN